MASDVVMNRNMKSSPSSSVSNRSSSLIDTKLHRYSSLAISLGGIGLGGACILAPRFMSRLFGVPLVATTTAAATTSGLAYLSAAGARDIVMGSLGLTCTILSNDDDDQGRRGAALMQSALAMSGTMDGFVALRFGGSGGGGSSSTTTSTTLGRLLHLSSVHWVPSLFIAAFAGYTLRATSSSSRRRSTATDTARMTTDLTKHE